MSGQEAVQDRFPKLAVEGYSVTSPRSDKYNCVAWVVRDIRRWWSPEDVDGYYWPWRDKTEALGEYLRLFEHCGFSECSGGDLEPGAEKIAVYGEDDIFDHVAFQLEDGTWSSKLGELSDVSHNTLSALTGAGFFEYPPVLLFMRRDRKPHPLAESGLLLPGG